MELAEPVSSMDTVADEGSPVVVAVGVVVAETRIRTLGLKSAAEGHGSEDKHPAPTLYPHSRDYPSSKGENDRTVYPSNMMALWSHSHGGSTWSAVCSLQDDSRSAKSRNLVSDHPFIKLFVTLSIKISRGSWNSGCGRH